MDFPVRAKGPWDLIIMSETIYYLGWLYSFFDVGWFAAELLAATRTGGRFLMANTCGGVNDHLLSPWLIRTYRDLFLNVGYHLESEELFSWHERRHRDRRIDLSFRQTLTFIAPPIPEGRPSAPKHLLATLASNMRSVVCLIPALLRGIIRNTSERKQFLPPWQNSTLFWGTGFGAQLRTRTDPTSVTRLKKTVSC